MSKCPFWSTKKEKVECNSECPMMNKNSNMDSDERCIFCECSFDNNIDIKGMMKNEFDFMNISIYDDERNFKVGY